jgi:hypothetical protein
MENPRKQRSYDKGNYPDFMNELEQKDWSSILSENEGIDANWKKFVDILRSLQDKYIPKKIRKQLGKSKSNFPMDKKTREKLRKKNILSKKIINNNDPKIREEYNRTRNQVKSMVNKLKKQYGKDLSQRAKDNPKAIWKYIKSQSKTREGIADLHLDPNDPKSEKKRMTIKPRLKS